MAKVGLEHIWKRYGDVVAFIGALPRSPARSAHGSYHSRLPKSLQRLPSLACSGVVPRSPLRPLLPSCHQHARRFQRGWQSSARRRSACSLAPAAGRRFCASPVAWSPAIALVYYLASRFPAAICSLRCLWRSDSPDREIRRRGRGSRRGHWSAFLLRTASRRPPRLRNSDERHRRCSRGTDRGQRLSRTHHADTQKLKKSAPAGALRRPCHRDAQRFLLRHGKYHRVCRRSLSLCTYVLAALYFLEDANSERWREQSGDKSGHTPELSGKTRANRVGKY